LAAWDAFDQVWQCFSRDYGKSSCDHGNAQVWQAKFPEMLEYRGHPCPDMRIICHVFVWEGVFVDAVGENDRPEIPALQGVFVLDDGSDFRDAGGVFRNLILKSR